MIPYIIKGGLHTYAFLLNLFMMAGPNQDIFTTLLSPKLHNDIASFVASHYQFALSTNQAFFALQSRFLVTNISINKAGMPAQHESFALWVFDRVTFPRHKFVIEHVPSDRSYTSRFLAFSQCPNSQSVLNSIQKAIHNMRLMTAQAAESLSAAIKTETETIPTPFNKWPLPQFVNFFTHFVHQHTPGNWDHSLTPYNKWPLLQFVNLLIHFIHQHTLQILGGHCHIISCSSSGSGTCWKSIDLTAKFGQGYNYGVPPRNIGAGGLYPSIQTWGAIPFQHSIACSRGAWVCPNIWSIRHHCYLFASVMFDTIIQLYSLPISTFNLNPNHTSNLNTGPIPAPTPEVGAPNNANIIIVPAPDQAGHWSGLLVLDPTVKAAVVSVVISQFKVQHASYMASVIP